MTWFHSSVIFERDFKIKFLTLHSFLASDFEIEFYRARYKKKLFIFSRAERQPTVSAVVQNLCVWCYHEKSSLSTLDSLYRDDEVDLIIDRKSESVSPLLTLFKVNTEQDSIQLSGCYCCYYVWCKRSHQLQLSLIFINEKKNRILFVFSWTLSTHHARLSRK